MDKPDIDEWMKATSQSLEQLKQILLEMRDAQRQRAEAEYRRAMVIGLQRPYLDSRQPRLDGDRFQNAAYPDSPNAGGEDAAQTGSGRGRQRQDES